VTDSVIEEVTAWQNRPLEACYALVFLDAIRVKIRDEGPAILIMALRAIFEDFLLPERRTF
jgi:transposase-like protein